jgi:hypothetical protein
MLRAAMVRSSPVVIFFTLNPPDHYRRERRAAF